MILITIPPTRCAYQEKMDRAPSRKITRTDNVPKESPIIGKTTSEGPMQPITSTNDDDVKPQESDDAESKDNNSEADKQQYQFVEESDCDGEESRSGACVLTEEDMEPFTFVTSTQVDFPVHVKM